MESVEDKSRRNNYYYGNVTVYDNALPTRYYFDIDNRITSFTGWNISFLNPKRMAEAGFFFLQRDDTVKCPFCGIEVCNWEKGDDPLTDHIKWSPSCRYVRQLVSNVKYQASSSPPSDSYTSRPTTSSTITGPTTTIIASSSSIEEGLDVAGSINDDVESTTLPASRSKEQQRHDEEEDSVPFSSNKTNGAKINKSIKHNGNDMIGNKNMFGNFETSSMMDSMKLLDKMMAFMIGIQCEITRLKNDLVNNNGFFIYNNAGVVDDKHSKEEKLNGLFDSGDGGDSLTRKLSASSIQENGNNTTFTATTSVTSNSNWLLFQRTMLDERLKCKICWEEEVCMLCVPCNHIFVCSDCFDKLSNCIICRSRVDSFIKVYIS